MNYKNYKVIKEYEDFILVEREAGYKECIHKQELGMIKEQEEPTR